MTVRWMGWMGWVWWVWWLLRPGPAQHCPAVPSPAPWPPKRRPMRVVVVSLVASDSSAVARGHRLKSARRDGRKKRSAACASKRQRTHRDCLRRQVSNTINKMKTGRPTPPPRRSGEDGPVGAFGACEGDRWPGQRSMAWRVGRGHHDGLGTGAVRQAATSAMASVAVHVGRSSGGCLGRSRGFVGCVLVRVVAEVRGLRHRFVPAIWRSRRPDGLERHKHQQEDQQQAAHGQRDSMEVFRTHRQKSESPSPSRGALGRRWPSGVRGKSPHQRSPSGQRSGPPGMPGHT